MSGIQLLAADDRAVLRGRVTGPDQEALTSIRVSIETATPKTGPRFLCPSCYVDCGKSTVTDSEGGFVIENVDPALRFELLFVGEGYVARSLSSVDSAGAAVDVLLDRLEIENIPAHRMVTGRIVDRFGDPIEHAVVAVSGRTQGRSSSWGRLRGFMKTPVAVTDDTGRFLLVANEDFDSLHLNASARNYANQEFYDVVADNPDQEFVLPRGATVTGRLLHDGQPLANRKIEIASENRRTRSNFTQTSVPTDDEGVFTFYNLPPKLVYNVTASMESIQDLGKTPLTRVGPLQDEKEQVIEDLVIEPGILLEGQVVTDDEAPIPADSVLLYTHDKVWGVQSILLPPDGRFQLHHLHAGKVRIKVRIPGYRLTARNRSFSGLNGGELLATLTQSKTDLVFMMEAGAWTEEPRRPNFPSIESVHNQPLRGVEPLHSNEQAASVRIRAKDADSGRSISEYWVSPGWIFDRGQHPVWHPYQRLNANATMLVPVAKRSGRAFVLVEADGYVPQSVEVDGQFGKTIEVSLSRGQGLRGVVLTPDGEPAVGAQVLMTKPWPNNDRPGLVFLRDGAFRWDTLQQHEHQLADLDGHFEFAPREVMRPIVIAHSSGYLEVKEPDPNAPLELRLQAWSGFEGVIKDLLDPELRLGVHRGATLSTEEPATSLFQKVLRKVGLENSRKIPSFWDFVTVEPTVERGENGRFKVDFVPPGRWNLSLMRFVKSKNIPGASEGRSVARTQAELAPGKRASVTLRPFSEGADPR